LLDENPIEIAEGLIASGRGGEAATALRARLAAGRGGLLARLTLVKALLAVQDTAGALAEAREAVSLNPDVAVAVLALGEALLAAQLLPTAIAELQRALRLDPGLVRARELVAAAWLAAGEADKALENLHTLENPPAQMIAAAQAIKAALRCDAGYVRHLFDQFSADYDARMIGQLAYAGPQILLDLAALVMPGRDKLAVLDLGCGTGLAGAVFKPLAARLDGVDLSPAMIEKARARQIYDRLAVADLEAALCTPDSFGLGTQYDLILAADTLVYLGDLEAVFQAVRARLRSDGYFLFTVEQGEGCEFELGPKRRWRHSDGYLRATAERAGLAVAGLVAATRGGKSAGEWLCRCPDAVTTRTFSPHCAFNPTGKPCEIFTQMVALDNSAIFGHVRMPRLKLSLGPLVGGIALVAAALVVGAILLRGFSENGFRLGSQLAWRYTAFVFFAALVAGPARRVAARFFPDFTPPESLSRKLVWGFCASYGVYLLWVFLPNVIDLSAGATLMMLFGGGVALVMAGTVVPLKRLGGKAIIPDKVRRVLLATATIYFWLCYCLMALARISGPHRPDAFYGFSLCLMVAGLLARYADRWLSFRDGPRPAV
jgi:predicted TPR repeat methyltransferase